VRKPDRTNLVLFEAKRGRLKASRPEPHQQTSDGERQSGTDSSSKHGISSSLQRLVSISIKPREWPFVNHYRILKEKKKAVNRDG
jgi:hypothetical protein